jgi:hypothetical protein
MTREKSQNRETLPALQLQVEPLTTPTSDACGWEEATLVLLAKQAERVGYLTAQLEHLQEDTRRRLADRDAKIEMYEFTLPPRRWPQTS